MGYAEIPDFLFFTAYKGDYSSSYLMGYDKKRKEIFNLNMNHECLSSSWSEIGLINDLNGYSPITVYNYQEKINAFVKPIFISLMDTPINIDCINKMKVKFPEKRKALIKMINESKENDNPILMIFHLK